FELDAESTDLLDDFLDSELSDDELLADASKSESLDPFDDLLTSGIEDELESEDKTFDKELDAAFGLDNANEKPEKDSDVELTPLTSEGEPEQDPDISETPQPEVVTDESLDSEMTQESSDIKPENDEAFNRDGFIDDLFGVAPATDALLDDSLETTDEALIDELMTSDDNDLLPAIEEPVEPSIENTVESEQAPLSNSNEVSAQETASSVEDDKLDIDSLLSENSDFDKPDFEERVQEESAQQESEPKEADVQEQASPSSLNDISEDEEETVEDWLAEAIDDVESPANIDSDFDFEPKIQGSDQLEDVVESLPEPEPE
ncbi:ATPase, partial [Vibrio sp. 10N.222.54.A1]